MIQYLAMFLVAASASSNRNVAAVSKVEFSTSSAPWRSTDEPPVAELARQSGITPETLAASGATGTLAAAALDQINQAPTEQQQFVNAQSSASDLAGQVSQLRQQVRQDPTNATLVAQLRAAKTQLHASHQSVKVAGDAVTSRAAAGLPSACSQRLAASRGGIARRTPPEFWAVARTTNEWKQLRADLTVERRAIRVGQALPAGTATRLAQARAHPDVVAATQAINTQLPSIRAAFEP